MKADIIGGRFPPRTVLIERTLAKEYKASVSPFRGGAFRLVGEKLLELHAGGGFQIPDITETGLRDLYFWHGQLLRNAVQARRRMKNHHVPGEVLEASNLATPEAFAAATSQLFSFIASQSPNVEHRGAILAAGERLHALRLKEPLVIGDLADEYRVVQALTAAGHASNLMTAIWAYHRRRLRRIADLVTAAGGTIDKALSHCQRRSKSRPFGGVKPGHRVTCRGEW
ncbi:GntR family transcriptional regulator, partial [Sphingobium sp. H39-3-25]|uniref:GntR family transcriptional regulator n=1 Tax=Sphingobium arseniciresistens TaxID=3030834 RepID=UPI0023B99077|nr:GntR family transcriptional regulator [Sphingobium arseniciresistens]